MKAASNNNKGDPKKLAPSTATMLSKLLKTSPGKKHIG